MTFAERLEAEGVQVDHRNSLPDGTRATKDMFARMIHTMRNVESAMERKVANLSDQLAQSIKETKDAFVIVGKLQEQVRILEAELRRMKQESILEGIDTLSVSDKKRLVDAS